MLGEISQHVFVTLPLNLKKVLLKIPFKNTILELNVALGRNIIVVIKEMDDWAKQQRTSTVYNATEGYREAVWGQAKNKDTDKFFVLIKSMRQHKPKSIQITKVFNPLKPLSYESQTLRRQHAGHHILLISHFYRLSLKSKKEA